jgi:hypothetical protein
MKRLLATMMAALACSVMLASSSPAQTEENCPPRLSGDWNGTWILDQVATHGGTIEGQVTYDGDTFSGPFALHGDTERVGNFSGVVTCDTFEATFTTEPENEVNHITGQVVNEGRTLDAEFVFVHPEFGEFPGFMTINIAAPVESLSIANSCEVTEGGSSDQSAVLALAAAGGIPKSDLRTASLPVTLSDPADQRIIIRWAIVGGTAVAGVDYVAPKSTVNATRVSIPRGKTETRIEISTIANSARDGDRTIDVEIEVLNADNIVYDPLGQITIRDDD